LASPLFKLLVPASTVDVQGGAVALQERSHYMWTWSVYWQGEAFIWLNYWSSMKHLNVF